MPKQHSAAAGWVGHVLAGHRIDGLIGEGGMGAVYRALHLKLRRAVALKVLPPALAGDAEYRRRFEREAAIAASLEHPAVVPIYDAGHDRGVLYLSMRLVEGEDLGAVLQREGPLPVDRLYALLAPVADALDAVHEAGLVHRDVKPGNILVAHPRRSRAGQVYLCDFGIAKGTADVNEITSAGQYVGTLQYSSPEQIQGAWIDGRSDQYGLACLAYRGLTGQVPFPREETPAVIYAHLAAEPPRPTALRPDLPAPVDAVIARAMAKEPDKRFPTCTAFVNALRDAGMGRPAPSQRVDLPRPHQPPRRPGAPLPGAPTAVPPGARPAPGGTRPPLAPATPGARPGPRPSPRPAAEDPTPSGLPSAASGRHRARPEGSPAESAPGVRPADPGRRRPGSEPPSAAPEPAAPAAGSRSGPGDAGPAGSPSGSVDAGPGSSSQPAAAAPAGFPSGSAEAAPAGSPPEPAAAASGPGGSPSDRAPSDRAPSSPDAAAPDGAAAGGATAGGVPAPEEVRAERDQGDPSVSISWTPAGDDVEYKVTRIGPDGRSRVVGRTRVTGIIDGAVGRDDEIPVYEVVAIVGGENSPPTRATVLPAPSAGPAPGGARRRPDRGSGPVASPDPGPGDASGPASSDPESGGVPPVSGLAVTAPGTLQFDWPPGVTEAMVVVRGDQPPATPSDPDATSWKITNMRYQLDGGLLLPATVALPVHVAVASCRRERGTLVVAPGFGPGARVTVQET